MSTTRETRGEHGEHSQTLTSELVTTFGLRDSDAELRVACRLSGHFEMSSEAGRTGEICISVSHLVEELGHVVEFVRRVEPSAVVRSCTAARRSYGSGPLSH